MRIYSKVAPDDTIRHFGPSESYDYQCGLNILAWVLGEEDRQPQIVSVVLGVIKDGRAEIRVQYEQEDYEAHKANLLVQRAVKEARTRIEAELRAAIQSL